MKIPKIFRKEYTEKKFRKKILGRIHIPEDRKYVVSLFKKKKETGTITFTAEPDKKELKRIHSLAKAIKNNSGLFVTWKLAIILVLAGAAAVFTLFFKNTLVEKYTEAGLERVFNAGADIRNMKVSLLSGQITFDSLEIQSEKRPDTNILETGPGVFQLDINQALKRRLRIIEMSIDNIMSGTQTSLPVKDHSGVEENSGIETGTSGSPTPSFALFGGGRTDYDFQGMLAEHKEDLALYRELEDLKQDAAEMEEKWSERLQDTSTKIERVSATTDKISSVNVSNLKDLNKLKDLQKDIETSYSDIRELRTSMSGIKEGIQADKNRITARKNAVKNGFDSDYEYMESFIDLPVSSKLTAAADFAAAGLGPRFRLYYSRLKTGMTVLGRIRGRKDEDQDTGKEIRRYQEFIQFPGTEYPGILIEDISAGFGGGISGTAGAQWISSDPDMVDEATRFFASVEGLPGSAGFEAAADMRNDKNEYSVSVEINGRPVSFSDGLEGLQIQTLGGVLSGELKADFTKGIDSGTAVFRGRLSETKAALIPGDSPIRSSMATLFADSPVIEFEGSFDIASGVLMNLDISSNFDDILSDQIGKYIQAEADKLRGRLREELNDYSKNLAGEYGISDSILNDESTEALSQIQTVEEAERTLDEKKAEVEAAVQSVTGDGLKKLKDNLKLPGF